MNLLWAGASASVLILALMCLRLVLVKRLPKEFFAALWWIPLVRLLLPLELPSMASLAQQSTPVREFIQASPVGAIETPLRSGIRVVLEPVAQEMERQAAATQSIPLWQVVWAAGTVLVLAYMVISTVCGYRKFAAALPEQSPEVAQWLSEQRMRRRVRVRQSDRIEAPMAYGLLRPVILLPTGFAKRGDVALPPVLEHEMAHILRFDPLAKMLQWAALALHWWNPLVWAMLLLCGRDMELACDQRALKESGGKSRADFARTLLTLSQGQGMQLATPYALSFSKYALEERIQQMMKPKRISIAALLIAVLVALLAVGMAGTAETVPMNEWLEQARKNMADMQVLDWETARDEGLETLYWEEVDGAVMYRPMHEDTWKTYEELVADQEDRYYIFTHEETEKHFEVQMAQIQALADNGAHFWIVGEGWVEDPQEAAQIMRETRQQLLEENIKGRWLKYVVLKEGETGVGYRVIETEHKEVRGTNTKVVVEFSLGDFFICDDDRTLNELRESLLDHSMDCVYYGVLTQVQANEILSADFLY